MDPGMAQQRASFSTGRNRTTCMRGSLHPMGIFQLTMLQTSVHPLQELRQVKATSALLKVHTQKDLNYDAYSPLLLSNTSDYDSKHSVKKGKRQIYAHDHVDHDDDDGYDASCEMDLFDIDTPVDTIQEYVSKFTPHLDVGTSEKVRMPKDKWFGLYQKTKDLWDQIDDKYGILGYTKSPCTSPFSSRSPFPPKQCYNINLHEMSACEFLQVHTHELEPDPTPEETVNEDPPDDVTEPETSNNLLINAAKGSRSTWRY
jgi:hypothetical protein